eukprot:CAMPEP_0202967942 /NCGR_PEP_ID=MMETSP1396-20130829/13006_1 /ASSEMBLY_ACC=CAM_ASM_000872 /TAXON_ID= /ORGANISM="Pseudokeronopsis sp., Strain Brazil" /LENGTH=37 /DNA_ID= /DNA_START= /DNA_END= /DNA_ORIENTATION=
MEGWGDAEVEEGGVYFLPPHGGGDFQFEEGELQVDPA